MTVHVDTSALVDALTGSRRSLDALIGLAEEGHRLSISAIVLYEWLRGPRTRAELACRRICSRGAAVTFGAAQAAVAARLYGAVKRPRVREIDLAVAACALHDGSALWTLNPRGFSRSPALRD